MYTKNLDKKTFLKKRGWFFLFGAAGSALLLFYDNAFTFFYRDILGLDAVLLATVLTVFSVWNAVNDPVFGFISDRTKSKWGRRKPYILLGAIPFGACFWFMFNPLVDLTNASQTTLAIYAFIILFFYDGFYSLVYSNWMALIPETYRDQNELRKFNLKRLSINVIVGIAVYLSYDKLRFIDSPNGTNMFYIGLIPAVLMPIFLLLCTIGIKENPMYAKTFKTSVGMSIKQAFQNKHFVGFTLYHSMFNVAKTLLMTNLSALAYYNLVTGKFLGFGVVSLVTTVTFVVVLLMYPLWNIIFKKVTKGWTNVVCLLIFAVACVIFQFVTEIKGAMVVAVLLGFAQSGYSLSHDLFNARQLDYHFAKTGQRAEGSYAGVAAGIDRLILIIPAWIVALIFAIGKHTAGTLPENMTSSALLAVKSVCGIGAAVFFIISAILSATLYGLRGETWKKVEAEAKAMDEKLIEEEKNIEKLKEV
ncbi:MAG: MFS transporter [Clostridia bacterium]